MDPLYTRKLQSPRNVLSWGDRGLRSEVCAGRGISLIQNNLSQFFLQRNATPVYFSCSRLSNRGVFAPFRRSGSAQSSRTCQNALLQSLHTQQLSPERPRTRSHAVRQCRLPGADHENQGSGMTPPTWVRLTPPFLSAGLALVRSSLAFVPNVQRHSIRYVPTPAPSWAKLRRVRLAVATVYFGSRQGVRRTGPPSSFSPGCSRGSVLQGATGCAWTFQTSF